MASLWDVESALVNMISAALYPNGVGAGSPLGLNFRVYSGHPGPDVLDADIQAGYTMGAGGWTLTTPTARIVHCCVNARPGVGRSLRPYVFQPASNPTPPPRTLTVAVSGTNLTIGGTIAAGQGVAAATAAGVAQGYTATATDTLATFAAALAANLTAGGAAATASGAVVSVPGAGTLYANTFVQVPVAEEWARQRQGFDITIYAPGRQVRGVVASAVKVALDSTIRFTLPDGFQAYMEPASPVEIDDDRPERALLFIRKIYYTVEYPTTIPSTLPTLAIAEAKIQDTAGDTLATVVEA
jgi:hypothetical protein